MKIGNALDNYIRGTIAVKYIPYIRRYSPSIYIFVRRLWEKLVPIKSHHNLARYQIRFIENFVNRSSLKLTDSVVLEIGSDQDGKVLCELATRGVRKAIGINPGIENEGSDFGVDRSHGLASNCELRNDNAEALSFADEYFTHVISTSVFEHLVNFKQCISEMHRVLRPGGCVYAEFGPIWSCSIGHHVYAVVGGEEMRHWDPHKNPIPNFAHLLMTKAELGSLLETKVSKELLEVALRWIYEQPFINRVFYEDYVKILRSSPFEIEYISTEEEYVDRSTLEKLCVKFPGYSRFDVRNVVVILRKTLGKD